MRRLRKIKSVILWIAVFCLMLIGGEGFLRLSGNDISAADDNPYLHIYEPLFSRVAAPGGRTMLECRRFIDRQDEPIAPFYEKKPSGTVRVFIVGGSVARFMDIDAFLKLLNETGGDTVFEIINCGYCGSESFGEKLIVSEILKYSPDLIILFSGNNEYYDTNGYNHRLVAINNYLRFSRLWCWFQDGISRLFPAVGKAPVRSWEQRHNDFEDNISGIAAQAKAAGVELVMCTMPANIHDNAPIGQLPVWNENFLRAYLYLELDRPEEARTLFKKLESELPQTPFVYYFAARAAEKLGDFEAARNLYVQAREYDFPHSQETRATASINNIIRRLCASSGAVLADLDKSYDSVSEHGVTGLDLMLDSCHWHWRTEDIVRNTIVGALADAGSPVWPIKYAPGRFDIAKPTAPQAGMFENDGAALAAQMDDLFDFILEGYITSWAARDRVFSDLFLMVCRMFHMAEFEECHECLVSGQEWVLNKYPNIFTAFESFHKRMFLLSAEQKLEKKNNMDAIRLMLYARACRRAGRSDRAVSLLLFALERSLPMPRWIEARIFIDLALAYFRQGNKDMTVDCLDRARDVGADVDVFRRVLGSL